MSCKSEPFLLSPAGKDYLWGGERLKEKYNKDIDLSPLAETWECSTHPDGESIAASGANKGKTLSQILREHQDWLGTHPKSEDGIPILVKFIDAKQDLSVQVHPDDEYAQKNENQLGKTEMWYVIEAEPGAKLVYGFKHDVTEEELREYIGKETLMKHLNTVPVHKGDVFFITPGTVHAIGEGALIAEIQESSNVTYRLYDYGRRDKNGDLRELHIDKAAQVLNYSKSDSVRQPMHVLRYKPECARELLSNCEYFRVERVLLNGSTTEEVTELSFEVLMCIDGMIRICFGETEIEIKKGNTVFIPAGSGKITVIGKGEMLMIRC